MQVYENGVVSFEREPFDFFGVHLGHLLYSHAIAPFYADVDIRGTGKVSYRQTTDFDLLTRATNEIQLTSLASNNASIKNLFIVTWDAVGYYYNNTDKVIMYMHTYVCS